MRPASFSARNVWIALWMTPLLALAGCRSPYIEATVHNASGAAVTVVEVDYPSASFGKESLADGAEFHYRLKIQGSGPLKVLWTDAANHDHAVAGPQLREGEEGRMAVTLTGSSAAWDLDAHPAR
jgi:hypothetical protein